MKVKDEQKIRALFSRDHDIVYPKLGVFLGGASPPDGEMIDGWRRKIVSELKKDGRLNSKMIVVSPEPQSGYWESIDTINTDNQLEVVRSNQMLWELQYLKLCDVVSFWFPTYWSKEKSGVFAPNIGPSSRWEFGYFLQEYLKNPQAKNFIVGSPEDAQNVEWAKDICSIHGIKWHILKKENKSQLIADSFIKEIADTLVNNQW